MLERRQLHLRRAPACARRALVGARELHPLERSRSREWG